MATLEEIAAATGVAPITVSRILCGRLAYRRKAPAARAERVRHVASEMGYRPNHAARAVRAGRFGAVSLIQSRHHSRSILTDALIEGLETGLAESNQHLLVTGVSDERLTDPDYVPRILREASSDGLLINYNALIPERMRALISEHGIPSVWINSKQAGDCVYPDDCAAAVDATRRLLSLGHRRIGFALYNTGFAETPWHYSGVDRREGCARAMREAGCEVHRLSAERNLPLEEYVPFTRNWLCALDRPTAVLTYGSAEARAILVAALMERVNVPRDLSVIAFGENPQAEMGLAVTTLRVPFAEIGRQAARMIMTKIASPQRALPAAVIPVELLDGQTVAAVPVNRGAGTKRVKEGAQP